MLPEHIDSVAPGMSTEIRRWFLEPDYAAPSVEHQDWHLILAEWDFASLLAEYVEDLAHPIEKRLEAFSALMVLQEFAASEPDPERKQWIGRRIVQIVEGDRGFARRACEDWLGMIEELVVRRILGEPIPDDVPRWMVEEARNRA